MSHRLVYKIALVAVTTTPTTHPSRSKDFIGKGDNSEFICGKTTSSRYTYVIPRNDTTTIRRLCPLYSPSRVVATHRYSSQKCVAVKVVSSQLFCRSESCCHVAVFLIKTPRQNRIEHFYGEPRCYHAATF